MQCYISVRILHMSSSSLISSNLSFLILPLSFLILYCFATSVLCSVSWLISCHSPKGHCDRDDHWGLTQQYASFTYQSPVISSAVVAQIFSEWSSLLTLAWSVSSFVRATRLTEPSLSNLSILDQILLTLAHFCSIVSQVSWFNRNGVEGVPRCV